MSVLTVNDYADTQNFARWFYSSLFKRGPSRVFFLNKMSEVPKLALQNLVRNIQDGC